MATQIAKGHIVNFAAAAALAKNAEGAASAWQTLTGSYVTPNLQSLRVTHTAEVDRIRGQDGTYTSLICDGEMIECEFTVIPEGTTTANAKISATLPRAGEAFAITGLPIIAVGDFEDALNTDGDNTQPWFYEGGGTVNLTNTEKATMTMTLHRYVGITSALRIS